MELKIFDRLKNFFRDDIGEVVGIYHDGEKIFLARLTDKLETLEQNFEIDFAEKIPVNEVISHKVMEFFSHAEKYSSADFFDIASVQNSPQTLAKV